MSHADTAWVLACAALVLLMTPGLALFYGGMVRAKNVLGTLMHSLGALALVSIVWAVLAYTLAFGPDAGGVIGGLRFIGLHGMDSVPGYHLSVPPGAFMVFQMMFAVITAALISGAGADRLRFTAFALFVVLWTLVVYAPLAHWVWSPHGWLARLGVLDFAGGTVVEVNSGASALAVALVLGHRRGWPREPMAPHSLPLTVLGAGLLWFGWFGFNAGSALAADGVAVHALIATHLAGCAGMVTWTLVERRRDGNLTTLGAASGAVAGLVAITPAAGYVDAMPALAIGAVAGAVSAWAVTMKFRLRYDDSLDVVGVHWVGGVIGLLMVGLFASHGVNPVVSHDGLLYGGGLGLLARELLGAVVATGFAFGMTYVVARVVDRLVGLRVTPEEEYEGLDTSQHAESAYDFGAVRALGRMGP